MSTKRIKAAATSALAHRNLSTCLGCDFAGPVRLIYNLLKGYGFAGIPDSLNLSDLERAINDHPGCVPLTREKLIFLRCRYAPGGFEEVSFNDFARQLKP